MKKLILAASLIMTSSVSFAAGDIGCGVGKMIFEGKEGVGPNVLGSITNGLTFNTVSMTFDLLDCSHGMNKGLWAMNDYLDSNLDKVAYDMSRGQGETLAGLATVMGVAEEHQAGFFQVSKANFDRIFSASDVTREQVVQSLSLVMKEDSILSQYAPQV